MSERAMPKPNCTEEVDVGTIEFGRLGRRVVEGRFDGGSMTSDGGVMLLGAVDRKLGLLEAASRCIADPRSPLLIKHAVRDMLRQRVYGLALGWEDWNDHGALRQDVAMQTAVGVDREVASAPTLCRLEKWADRASAWRLHRVLVDQFIASFKTAPKELVLNFDATDNPLHGQQEGRFFQHHWLRTWLSHCLVMDRALARRSCDGYAAARSAPRSWSRSKGRPRRWKGLLRLPRPGFT